MKGQFILTGLQIGARKTGQFMGRHKVMTTTVALSAGLFACGGILQMTSIPVLLAGSGFATVLKMADKMVDRDRKNKSALSNTFFYAATGITALAGFLVATVCPHVAKDMLFKTRGEEMTSAFASIAQQTAPRLQPGTSSTLYWEYEMTPFVGHQNKKIFESIKTTRLGGDGTDMMEVCNREKCRVFKYDRSTGQVTSLKNE